MDKFDKFILGLGLSIAMIPASTASAQGLPEQGIGYARTIGTTHISKHGKQATLTVRYSCDRGDHLWVSLKQSATGKRNPAIQAEGSGGKKVAKTWLDSHRNPVVCDNQRHTARFTVDQKEPGKYGKLRRGSAWLQFCVTDSSITDMNDPRGLVTYLPKWVPVR
jgi:hypothetical protein